MIIYFIFNTIVMIILSYYSKSVPELFLISIILLAYKKDINKNYLKVYVLFAGYFNDVFYYTNYPIYTLTYFIIYLIVFHKVKDFIIFDFFNLLRITFIFIFMEKLLFIFFNLSTSLNIIIHRDIASSVFEILSTIFFLFIYYKLNNFIKEKKIYIIY